MGVDSPLGGMMIEGPEAEARGDPMGVLGAEKITSPRQLELPPEAGEVLNELTESGRQRFIAEILDALQASRKANDLRPVQDVIVAWYRSMLAVRSPTYEAGIEWALSGDEGETLTLEEFRDRYTS
jgi:hypothetical protein